MAGITISKGESAAIQSILASSNFTNEIYYTEAEFSYVVTGMGQFYVKDNTELTLEIIDSGDYEAFDASEGCIMLPTATENGAIKITHIFSMEGQFRLQLCANDGFTHYALKYIDINVHQEHSPVDAGTIKG